MISDRPVGPDFLCIGAQKGGTGWLYDQLEDHPEFWMPPVKELHFLDRDTPRSRAALVERVARRFGLRESERKSPLVRQREEHRGRFHDIDSAFLGDYVAAMREPLDLDRYAALFAAKGRFLTGDVTPAYSILGAEQIADIHRRFPWLKIVFIARHPVERLWSQYRMAIRKNEVSVLTTADEILEYAARPNVIDRSLPSAIVRRWRACFPPEQFGLFFFDDLRENPAAMRHRMLAFLGASDPLASGRLPANYNRKQDRNKMDMTVEIRSRLSAYFSEEIRRCADELGGASVRWADELTEGAPIASAARQ